MSTLDRLLDALSRVYDTTPDAALGLRLSYDSGQMQWAITDDTLTTTVVGGSGGPLSIDLSQYTLSSLVGFLVQQPGYSVPFLDDTGLSSLSALALVPSAGDLATSNGDHLFVARNPTWTYLAAIAAELTLAQTAIEDMPAEMATTTADGIWLDVLGGYYAVPRQLGELDDTYGPRIPAEVILPRQNNTAIAAALEASTGQLATCNDAPIFGHPEPAFDGAISFTGAPHFYNASAQVIFNLFDVSIGYALLGSLSPSDYLLAIRQQIDRLRAAGTHLRTLTLTPSILGDSFTAPTDALVDGVSIAGIQGTGQSFDFGVCEGIFPLTLIGLTDSRDAGRGQLSSQTLLMGTGSSVDRVALPILAGTGSSIDGVSGPAFSPGFSLGFASIGVGGAGAVLRAGAGAVLVGTGSSIDSTFASTGSAVIFNGVSSSTDSAIAALRIGAGFIAAPSSANSGTSALSSAIKLVGTGGSSDSASLDAGRMSVSPATSSNGATGTLTAKITLAASATSTDTATGLTSSAPVGTAPAAINRTEDFLGTLGVPNYIHTSGAMQIPVQYMADIGALGVRVVRFDMELQASMSSGRLALANAIVAAGIKIMAIPMWVGGGGQPYNLVLSDMIAQLKQIHQLGSGNNLVMIEGINEPSNFSYTYLGVTGGGSPGSNYSPIAQYMHDLYVAVRADPVLASVPVSGITNNYGESPNCGLQWNVIPAGATGTTFPVGTQFSDRLGIHVYPEFYNSGMCQVTLPGVGDAAQVSMFGDHVSTSTNGYAGYSSTAVAMQQPWICSEYNFHSGTGATHVPDSVKAKNVLTGLMSMWKQGASILIVHSVYEEADGYGIYSATRVPTALVGTWGNLQTIMNDSGASKATFNPTLITVTVSGLPSSAVTQLFQKSTGEYQLLIWNNVKNYDGTNILTIPPTTLTIAFPTQGTIKKYDITVGSSPTQTLTATSTTTVTLTDIPLIVEWK